MLSAVTYQQRTLARHTNCEEYLRSGAEVWDGCGPATLFPK